MNLRILRTYLLPHELIVLPFLVLVFVIYQVYDLNFTFFPPFIYWLILISVLLLFLYFSCNFFAATIKYLFDWQAPTLKVNKKKLFGFLRIFASLMLVLVVYENLQLAIASLSPVDQDPALLFYDQYFFGEKHITLVLQSYVLPKLTEWFNFAYLSFFFYLPILGVYFYIRGRLSEWVELVFVTTLTLFSGYILYIFFPALGPAVYLYNDFHKTLDGALITQTTQNLINTQGFARGTFPSLHIACSTVYLYFAYRNSSRLFLIFLPIIVSLWISTIYLRQHYLIDVWAGYCLAIICIFFGNLVIKKWNEKA